MFLSMELTPLGYILNILFLCVGVLLLVKGADWFVASSSSIAKKFKISSLVIGLTVVSFGTSAPELAVSTISSIKGVNGIALGNVVGSNICNIALVLGLSALISPIVIKKSLCKREIPFLLMTTIVLAIFVFDNLLSGYLGYENLLSRGECIIFLALFVVYCYISIIMAQKEVKDPREVNNETEDEIVELPMKKTMILLILGLSGIIMGAEFVTTPAKNIATSIGLIIGVEESLLTNLVGLTVVAVGTSLPELVTSVIAAKKGENEIAVGNVVGSNIFNILLILGVSGVITPHTMSADIMTDIILSLALVILMLAFAKRGKMNRIMGLVLVLCYVLYLSYIVTRLFFPGIVIPA